MLQLTADPRDTVPVCLLIEWLRGLRVIGHRKEGGCGFLAGNTLEVGWNGLHVSAGPVLQFHSIPVRRPVLLTGILSLEDVTAIRGLRIPCDLEFEPALHGGGKARVLLGTVPGYRPFLEEMVGDGAGRLG